MPVSENVGRTPGRFNVELYLYTMKIILSEIQVRNLMGKIKPSQLNEDVSKEQVLKYFGFRKELEKTLPNGVTVEGFGGPDKKYDIRVMVANNSKVKILYRGPSFGNPEIIDEDLTIKWFQREWISISDTEAFAGGLDKALKYAKSIRDYNEAPSLPKR
jgi:hypothetical protein